MSKGDVEIVLIQAKLYNRGHLNLGDTEITSEFSALRGSEHEEIKDLTV